MYVKVRTVDGKQSVLLTISKLTTVNEFRKLVEDKMEVPPERQRLFYRGKQMEDGYKMFDYDININDVIQLMIRPVLAETNKPAHPSQSPRKAVKHQSAEIEEMSPSNKENNLSSIDAASCSQSSTTEGENSISLYYKVDDLIDALDYFYGGYFEAKIVKITPHETEEEESKNSREDDDGLIYHVVFDGYDDDGTVPLKLGDIRPRARTLLSLNELKVGDLVMANYNVDEPSERGYWYDCRITNIKNTRTVKQVTATVYYGPVKTEITNCKLLFLDEIMKIEPHITLVDRVANDSACLKTPPKRENAPSCAACKDNKRRKCKECGCHECGVKDDPDKQIMCDECDMAYHIWCLKPPLDGIPDVEEWYCHYCKNDDSEIVKAGEKLKASKRKAQMASSKGNTSRDWGKGMACVGRQKICTLVPSNHFGPIPGVEVGQSWKFRVGVSEAGVHRPHVSGIAGRGSEGAYSIVLSGGYEDDEDRGEEFTYTGSGGRDLSGNKRTAEQSCDQKLTKMNLALALNVNAKLNSKNGAEAVDWKGGKPVRVVRNYKGAKHSTYAPEEGNRYDGIYKIVKYWPEKGKSGYIVWRYLMRRDDSIPAPWTKQGKRRIKELDLAMVYPEGYLEAQQEKLNNSTCDNDSEGEKNSKKSRKRKRAESPEKQTKKSKHSGYTIEEDISKIILADEPNIKLWRECKDFLSEGRTKFLSKIEEVFQCICCQELVCKPVTTDCNHNICLSCLQRSFRAEVYSCPCCRYNLGEKYNMNINKNLFSVLKQLFPGYDAGR